MTGGFRPEELERYARQIVLPGVGGAGQRRWRDARIAVVGAGGLGSPALLHLAAAGVGRIAVIDHDAVDAGNLHRQVLHRTADIGRPKAESAAAALGALNPLVAVEPRIVRLDASNAEELLGGADLVLDGSDNFPTRYAVADACHRMEIPLASGSIFRFDGTVAAFPHDGSADAPCYRCLHPEAPPAGTTPSCAEAGAFGPTAAVVGGLMAGEALKILAGLGEALVGRILVWEGLAARVHEIRVARRPGCPHPPPQRPSKDD